MCNQPLAVLHNVLPSLVLAKPRIVRTCTILKKTQHYLQCLRSGYLKFQLNQASSFEVIALDSKASKKLDLYWNHIENKLQALTFAAITFVNICLQSWDLA